LLLWQGRPENEFFQETETEVTTNPLQPFP
jgi:hypothetical protein